MRAGSTLAAAGLDNAGRFLNEGQASLGSVVNRAGAEMQLGGRVDLSGLDNQGLARITGDVNTTGDVNNAGGSLEVAPGAQLVVTGGHWYRGGSEGSVTRVDGLLAASFISFGGGRLQGNGTLRGTVFHGIMQLAPGNSVGAMRIEGDVLGPNSITLEMEVAGATDFDRLAVAGSADFVHMDVMLREGFRPTLGDSFALVAAGGALSFGSWDVAYINEFGDWVVWATDDGLILDPGVPADWRVQFSGGTLAVVAVPEPQTWALWLGGLGLMLWLRARRRMP